MSVFARRGRAKVRRIMRGSRALKGLPDPSMLATLNEEITVLNLGFKRRDCSRLVFDLPVADVELATRQYLMVQCGATRLNAAILESMGAKNGSTVASMPSAWIRKLRLSGIPVAGFRSRLLFARLVVRNFRLGVRQIAGILLRRRAAGEVDGIAYAHFFDLAPSHLPRLSGAPSRDIVSWYLNWKDRAADIREIRHTVPGEASRKVGDVLVRPVAATIPALNGSSQRVRFVLWSIGAILAAAFGLATGRWAGALMLGEAARAQLVALTPPADLAREYLFSLGSAIYRPLWSYTAEAKGSRVTLYNYAASFGGFKTKEPDVRPLEFGLQSMTWPRILMWTEPYARFFRTAVRPETEIKLVPAIWFSDADEELPTPARPCVGVFDVTPVRSSGKAFNVNPFEYRTFDIGRKFLEDVYSVVHGLEYDIVWKRKRGYGSIHDKRYIAFADAFALRPGVLDVSPGISAFRVVEKCRAVISMPFTSTAFIASQIGIPSVFYDPTGLLFKDDCGAQGVPLLSGREELSSWLEQVTVSSNTLTSGRGVSL